MEKQDWKDMAFYLFGVGIIIGLGLGMWLGQSPERKILNDCYNKKNDADNSLLTCQQAVKNCALQSDLEVCERDLKICRLFNETKNGCVFE